MIALIMIIFSWLMTSTTGSVHPAQLIGRLFTTVTEAAKILEVDPRTLRRSIEAGECPAVRISDTVRIPVGPFLRWAGIDLEASEAPTATDEATAPTQLSLAKTSQSHDHSPAA
jgi:excisionase family DNA binding protein